MKNISPKNVSQSNLSPRGFAARLASALVRLNKRRRAVDPLTKSPVLRAVYPDKLAWDWDYAWQSDGWDFYKSTDGGVTWTKVGAMTILFETREIVPADQSALYAVVLAGDDGTEMSARSNGVHPTDGKMVAPVLSPLYPSKLSWVWNLTDPYRWNVWMSLDNGISWTLVEDYWTPGTDREFGPDGGSQTYFIVGVDNAGKEITERSNAVRPDDAPRPLSAWTVNPYDIFWFWNHANPYQWRVLWRLDAGHEWNFTSDWWHWGSARKFVPDGDTGDFCVVGVDDRGVEVTQRSNIVHFPGTAPVLTATPPYTLAWTWSLPEPYQWRVLWRLDSGHEWNFTSDWWHWGNSRTFTPDGDTGEFCVVGVDQFGTEITPRSAAVHFVSLLAAPKLAASPSNTAAWVWELAIPYRWNIYKSTDSGATYVFSSYLAGTARSFTVPAGADHVKIVGVDSGNVETTVRSNAIAANSYVRPAAPVITTVNYGSEGDEGAQTVWLDLTWTWNPGAWPDDGVFQILGCKDDTQGMFLMATVPASARQARVETTLPLQDTVYYYQMVYIHGDTYGAWTPVGEFYPF